MIPNKDKEKKESITPQNATIKVREVGGPPVHRPLVYDDSLERSKEKKTASKELEFEPVPSDDN